MSDAEKGSSMERSLAAWQNAIGTPLEIAEVTTPLPGPNEILVRNHSIAINPVDWILQENPIFPWLDYPAILGSDVAGEVVAVGSDVERFKIGDRVLGSRSVQRPIVPCTEPSRRIP